MRCRLVRDYRFEAAHFLPKVPEDHKCRRVHGHSYRVSVTIDGPLDPELGWVMDFGDLDEIVQPAIAALDHRLLNDIDGLENPTCEILSHWLWQRLAPALPDLLEELSVSETRDSRCVIRRQP